VITGDNPAYGRQLGLPTFVLAKLNQDRAIDILTRFRDINREAAESILAALPSELNSLAKLPLALSMIGYAYLTNQRTVPASRAALYKIVVDGFLSQPHRNLGLLDKSEKLHLLSLLARWMQDCEIYSISALGLGGLLTEWMESGENLFKIAHLRTKELQVREELLKSGLLKPNAVGEYEFAHEAFRIYLAAQMLTIEGMSAALQNPTQRTSIVLWAGVRKRPEVDVLLDQLARYPLTLGRVLQERSDHHEVIRVSLTDEPGYFVRLFENFLELSRQFKILHPFAMWRLLAEGTLGMLVAQASNGSYLTSWHEIKAKDEKVEWVPVEEITKILVDTRSITSGFPCWLFPKQVVELRHPAELAYSHILRALDTLIDALPNTGGGLDIERMKNDPSLSPGIAKIQPAINAVFGRFQRYNDLGNELPLELRAELPFYASQGYDQLIEVYAYQEPAVVRYVTLPGLEANTIRFVPSFLTSPDEEPLFKKVSDGIWHVQFEGDVREVRLGESEIFGETGRLVSESTDRQVDDQPTLVKEETVESVLATTPAAVAKEWLKDDLTRLLYGFPVKTW
jgi:hypothetical protein